MLVKKNKKVIDQQINSFEDNYRLEHEINVDLQKENEELRKSNRELMDSIAELKNKVDVLAKNNVELRSKNQFLTEEYNSCAKKFTEQVSTLTATNATQNDSIADLSASLAAVSTGCFSQEHIELAILKSFKGFKYVYYNGSCVEDLENIDSLSVSWDKGERVRMTVDR